MAEEQPRRVKRDLRKLPEIVEGLNPNDALEAFRQARRAASAALHATTGHDPAAGVIPQIGPSNGEATPVPDPAGSAPPDAPVPTVTPADLAMAGHLDLCNQNLVEGWLAWVHLPQIKIGLEIFHLDQFLGACVADLPRDDLAAAGYGEGRCAFSFVIPFEARVADPAGLRIRIAETPLFLLPDTQTRRTAG